MTCGICSLTYIGPISNKVVMGKGGSSLKPINSQANSISSDIIRDVYHMWHRMIL